MLFSLLRHSSNTPEIRDTISNELKNLSEETDIEYDNELLNEAFRLKQDGRFNDALERIEEVLQEEPNHSLARNLKIEILEKKRRFVEASELKHEVNRSKHQEQTKTDKKESVTKHKTDYASASSPDDIEISLIIPTTTYGKPALENCLISVSEHCDTSNLELIVIDNASLDDTHDYVDELKEKNFLNCQVITNSQNIGFPASINQGIEKATGDYACIIHNDVEFTNDAISRLYQLMENNADYAIIGPVTDKTLNPEQAKRNIADDAPKLINTEYLDSFCMMVRIEADLQMDEDYKLAFFEDIDLCFQARSNGHKVGIAPHIKVEHHLGTTTFSIGLDTESEQYWKNISYFNEKWDIDVFSQEELKSLSTFDQLLTLDDIVNPVYPEQPIKDFFKELLTDELKTEIMKARHDGETLCKLVHLFMVMDEREIMRRLEDRLDSVELPPSLIYQLVRFYYDRNIFSRCKHYLDRLKPQHDSLRADLYRLAIHVENKDMEEAIPILKHLMDHAPANPMLYKLAGDIHKFNGNDDEAHSFYDLAEQINPFEFTNEEKDAFGFKI
jgi:GT2 family glycosyltransferase/antitoxin component HigA of HigAB toxin-antitoxin module